MTPEKPTEKKTSLNMELFKKIKKHILARPSRLRMDTWVRRGNPKDTIYNHMPGYGEPENFKLPDCGTVGCIAGWAVLLANPDLATDKSFGRGEERLSISTASYAASDLHIKAEYKPFELFYVDYWPTQYADSYRKAKTQKERAKLMCEVIDEFTAQYQLAEELDAR